MLNLKRAFIQTKNLTKKVRFFYFLLCKSVDLHLYPIYNKYIVKEVINDWVGKIKGKKKKLEQQKQLTTKIGLAIAVLSLIDKLIDLLNKLLK